MSDPVPRGLQKQFPISLKSEDSAMNSSPLRYPRFRCVRNRSLAVICVTFATVTMSPDSNAQTLQWNQVPTADWPANFAPLDSATAAYAYYDYTTTQGQEGQYTDLYEGASSLFQEDESGISGLTGDWTWVAGEGWTATDAAITFHWGNVYDSANIKQFFQSMQIPGGIPDLSKIVVTTTPGCSAVVTHEGYSSVTGTLVLGVTVTPQPGDVWVTVPLTADAPIIVESGWVLDQCSPIPETSSTLALLGLGTLSLLACDWRRRMAKA